MIVQRIPKCHHEGTKRLGVEGVIRHGSGSYCPHVARVTSARIRSAAMQGVIKSYDPGTGDGVLINEADLADVDLADNALEGSIFRMLRQGQRVQFELNDDGRATRLRLGSEIDMGTPDL